MLAGWALLGLTLIAAAPPAYCTGQRITDDFGVLHYPNGQRVVDGFGKELYPNGTRVTNDYGDEIRYSNGGRVRSASGDLLFPNGTAVKTASGQVRYPNGQQVRTATGTCYFETGVEGGAIDLRRVRYEFPSGAAVITLAADLAAGRLDRASIAAACPSTR